MMRADGLPANPAYTWGIAKDINSNNSTQAASGWRFNPTAGDPNNPQLTYSQWDRRHRFLGVLSYRQDWGGGLATTFGLFYNGQSGRPFSYLVTGDVEIRDAESALSAIQAAETGHLVISTLHTIDCIETINRVLDLFPPQQAKEVRTSFAGALRGIVSQRLVTKADGKGRVPAVEVLVNTGRVFDRLVDPDQTDSIVDVISDGGYYGMQSFDQALVTLVKDGLVTVDEARRTATSPHDFDLQLSGVLDRGSAFSDEQKTGLPF